MKYLLKFIALKNKFNHFLILKKWLNQKAVLEFYEGLDQKFSYKKIKNKFLPKINNLNIHPFLIIFNHKKIGYLQFYYLENAVFLNYQKKLKIISFDLFLGKKYQNKGLCVQIIKKLIDHLKTNEFFFDKIIVDPLLKNIRAIKCYEKCGFEKIKILKKYQLHNNNYEDLLIMELKT